MTRERYHEYRYREDMEGSECVPVLLDALGKLTGTDAGSEGRSPMSWTGGTHTVVADRRPAPARVAGPVHRGARPVDEVGS